MRNILKSVVCLIMAVTLLLTDAPAYVYAVNSTETIATVGTETVGVENRVERKGSLKVLELMEAAKQEVNATVAILDALKAPYVGVAIAQVNDYVNVRAEANTESEVLGKLYNKSAATVLETT